MRARALALAAFAATIPAGSAAPLPTRPRTHRAPPPGARLGTYVRGSTRLASGSEAALRVATHYATDEHTAVPLGGVDVTVRLAAAAGRAALPLWRGRTDDDGVADVRFAVPALPPGSYTLAVDSRSAIGDEHHAQSITISSAARLRLSSDKPIYQPAQTIHLRALALGAVDLRPVAGATVTFDVEDPRGNRTHHESARTSAFGVAAVDLALADDILLGGYKARATLEGGASEELALAVDRYALPKLAVTVDADRPFYAPGDRAKLTVSGRYFFGKPVAGGAVEVSAEARGEGGASLLVGTLRGRTREDGTAALEMVIPAGVPDGAALTVTAQITDGARHVEHARRDLVVAREALRLDAIAESGRLVARAANRVWVVATRPDGTPAAGVDVAATTGGHVERVTTDAIGMALVTVEPGASGRRDAAGCGARALPLELAAGDGAGGRAAERRCLPVDDSAPLLLRTDRALYPAGAPIAIDVTATDGSDLVFVDLAREDQTVATAVAHLDARGHGAVTLAPPPSLFGTVAVHAYRVGRDGRRAGDDRVVYVERPGALTVTATPDASSHRPGGHAEVHLHVADPNGRGVRASLGVVMVDESVLALRAIPSRASELFFLLAREASHPSVALRHGAGGYTIERLLGEAAPLDALRDRAAQALLAGAKPPWSTFEIDPWELREDAWREQRARLADAITRRSELHDVATFEHGRWRWRAELLAELAAAGAVKRADLRDPWGRTVTVARATAELDAESLALASLEKRLDALYRALDQAAARPDGLRLAVDASAASTRARRRRPAVVLTAADLARLPSLTSLPVDALHDPWGRPWRIKAIRRPVYVGTLLSRYLVTSLGPDGRPDTDDDRSPWFERPSLRLADLRPGVSGVVAGRASYAMGSLGGVGYGAGYGALGMSLANREERTNGRGVAAAEPARVRQSFPETMLWVPELVTDGAGDARLPVELADSITTWLLRVEAVDASGHLGGVDARLRVTQDFFVDLDLPPVLTQHDEVAVPVAVYNYLPTATRVRLELTGAEGFTPLGERLAAIDLRPSEVGVRYFRVRAERIGLHALTVTAATGGFSDAVKRSVEVFPDGSERGVAWSEMLRAGAASSHDVTIPPDALADASVVGVKVYPGMASHVVEGLDSMLRMPGGCFEQTSSSNYPNALILDYLRRTGGARPEVEKKARELLSLGYQRLLSFEVPGGGFSWFGNPPANQVLTAYGLEEFHDMARVHPVDPRVIERTRAWLESRQRSDGSWAPDSSFINEGATNRFNTDVTRITAYVAVSLARAGGARSNAVARARRYVMGHLGGVTDPYTLALVGRLLAGDDAHAGGGGSELAAVLDRLWATRHDDRDGARFRSTEKTPTYGDGRSGDVETTALAVTALLDGRAPVTDVERAVRYLVGAKDPSGNWYSTQATILALKALLAWQEKGAKQGRGVVHISVDGTEVASATVDGASGLLQGVDLAAAARPGARRVSLRYDGTGAIGYQLLARWYEPRAAAPPPPEGDLRVRVSFDRTTVAPSESVTATVRVTNGGARAIDMPIVTAGLPPGFDLDPDDLERLVATHAVAKVQRTAREAVLYLTEVPAARAVELQLHLRPRFPARVQAPPPRLYEYYRPEHRADGAPTLLTVTG